MVFNNSEQWTAVITAAAACTSSSVHETVGETSIEKERARVILSAFSCWACVRLSMKLLRFILTPVKSTIFCRERQGNTSQVSINACMLCEIITRLALRSCYCIVPFLLGHKSLCLRYNIDILDMCKWDNEQGLAHVHCETSLVTLSYMTKQKCVGIADNKMTCCMLGLQCFEKSIEGVCLDVGSASLHPGLS